MAAERADLSALSSIGLHARISISVQAATKYELETGGPSKPRNDG